VKILDRLPIGEQPRTIFVGSEPVTIKRYQIGIWVSINDPTRPFLAILDSGHSHNFSITESQLQTFAGLEPRHMKFLGTTRLKGERQNQYAADVRIHHNRPRTLERDGRSYRLVLDEGISIAREGTIRLPVLGLRAIVRNCLKLTIEGKRRQVSLRKGWL
jgi:hypothetical protein